MNSTRLAAWILIFISLFSSDFTLASTKLKDTLQAGSASTANTLELTLTPDAWTVDLGFDSSQSQIPTPDQSTALTSDVDYDFENQLTLGGGINFTNTKTDRLVGVEPHVTFGGTVNLKAANPKNDDEFIPDLTLLLDLGSNSLRQTGVTRGVQQELSISQASVGFEVALNPWEWVTLKISTTKYSYDKDVAAFVSSLQNAKLFALRAGMMADGLLSLEDYLNEVSLKFYYGKFNLKLSASFAQEAATKSNDQDINALLSCKLDHWLLGLGAGQSTTANITQGYGIISVGYQFN